MEKPSFASSAEREFFDGLNTNPTNVEAVHRVAQKARNIADAAKRGLSTDNAGRVISGK